MKIYKWILNYIVNFTKEFVKRNNEITQVQEIGVSAHCPTFCLLENVNQYLIEYYTKSFKKSNLKNNQLLNQKWNLKETYENRQNIQQKFQKPVFLSRAFVTIWISLLSSVSFVECYEKWKWFTKYKMIDRGQLVVSYKSNFLLS